MNFNKLPGCYRTIPSQKKNIGERFKRLKNAYTSGMMELSFPIP